MDPRTILTRGVSTGLRLGRGTADRVVTVAGPPLGRLSDKVVVEDAPPRAGAARRRSRPPSATTSPRAEPRADAAKRPVTCRRGPQHRPAAADGEARPAAGQAEERPRREAATSARQHVLVRTSA